MASHKQSSREEPPLASGDEEEADYESDSEGGTSALALRRRVASDVDEDDHELNVERDPGFYDDDAELDQGAPPDEDKDQEEEEEESIEEEYDYVEEVADLALRRNDVSEEDDEGEENFKRIGGDVAGGDSENAIGSGSKEELDEEKKNSEPFVVPTAGAFYMHDDRFRYSGIVRPRRSAGGRKLWEAKDEKRWVHDRFEELKLNEENFLSQGRRGRRGRGREGRGQGRGKDLISPKGRGRRDRAAEDAVQFPLHRVRGRGWGLRRARMDDYEFKQMKPAGHRGESGAPVTPKAASLQPTGKPEEAASNKPTTSSVLNSESPPFFPTGALTCTITGGLAGQRKGSENKLIETDSTQGQVGRLVSTSRTGIDKGMRRSSPASVARSSSGPGNITSLISDSNSGEGEAGLFKSLPRVSNTTQQQLLKTGSGSMLQQRPVRAEGSVQHMIEQSSLSVASQPTIRGTPSPQISRLQHPQQQLQMLTQGQISRGQPVQSQALVSPIAFATQPAVDSKVASSIPGNKLGMVASGRGTQATTVQAGRGSFMYGGGSLTNGLRSVVQFTGQPQGNLGVPTVGVALPGYSSQPQFGFSNSSEVTWIPILAGSGSLGSNYSSSYISVDGSSPAVYYTAQASPSHTQQGSQTLAFPVSGRETNGLKVAASNSMKPPARSEADELGQQRRRYSQMTFGEERR